MRWTSLSRPRAIEGGRARRARPIGAGGATPHDPGVSPGRAQRMPHNVPSATPPTRGILNPLLQRPLELPRHRPGRFCAGPSEAIPLDASAISAPEGVRLECFLVGIGIPVRAEQVGPCVVNSKDGSPRRSGRTSSEPGAKTPPGARFPPPGRPCRVSHRRHRSSGASIPARRALGFVRLHCPSPAAILITCAGWALGPPSKNKERPRRDRGPGSHPPPEMPQTKAATSQSRRLVARVKVCNPSRKRGGAESTGSAMLTT